MDTIRNPIEWSLDQIKGASRHSAAIARTLVAGEAHDTALPAVNVIEISDLKEAIARGIDDFKACRTDVLALSIVYPVAGLLLWWTATNYSMLHLLFPLVSGFALLGPVAAVGLYEMSRQRELGKPVSWADAFEVVKSPAFGSILILGLILVSIFLLWLAAAHAIYAMYLGPDAPASVSAFLRQVFTTPEGVAMAMTGIATGFFFALGVFSISAVSFPMLLDRNPGLSKAVVTSVRAVVANPRTMAVWGLIVAGTLFVASLPALLGLVVAVPVLGHATWHLYRKLVANS